MGLGFRARVKGLGFSGMVSEIGRKGFVGGMCVTL